MPSVLGAPPPCGQTVHIADRDRVDNKKPLSTLMHRLPHTPVENGRQSIIRTLTRFACHIVLIKSFMNRRFAAAH
jgi:hypothetical protein